MRSRSLAVISPRRYGIDADAGGLHLGEHAHQRQLDLAVQTLETELQQARALRRRQSRR